MASPGKDPHFGSVTQVVLLSLILGIVAYATDMYLPAFPAIGQAFGTNPQAVQLSLSVFLYGAAAGHLFFGPLSDRYGRRPILLYGLAAYTLATFGCAFAADISSFLIYRATQGIAAASGPVLIRALINDRLDRNPAAQMFALLTGLMALFAMFSPIAGGWLVQHRTWHWIFYAIGSISILLIFCCFLHDVRNAAAGAAAGYAWTCWSRAWICRDWALSRFLVLCSTSIADVRQRLCLRWSQ